MPRKTVAMLSIELTEFAITTAKDLAESLRKTAELEFQLTSLSNHFDDLVIEVQKQTQASINSYQSLKRRLDPQVVDEKRSDPFVHKPKFKQVYD